MPFPLKPGGNKRDVPPEMNKHNHLNFSCELYFHFQGRNMEKKTLIQQAQCWYCIVLLWDLPAFLGHERTFWREISFGQHCQWVWIDFNHFENVKEFVYFYTPNRCLSFPITLLWMHNYNCFQASSHFLLSSDSRKAPTLIPSHV